MSQGSKRLPSLLKSMSSQVEVGGTQGPSLKMERKASMSVGSKLEPSLLKSMSLQVGPQAPGQVVPPPAKVPPAPLQLVGLRTRQKPLLKQHAPLGWGQLAVAQLALLPR